MPSRVICAQRAGRDLISELELLSAQLVLDLAIDLLELARKIRDQHLQAPLAVIDDPPEFGALRLGEVVVAKPDAGLDDLAAPRLRPRVDEFSRYPWHALSPERAASGANNTAARVPVSGRLAAWLTGLSPSRGQRRFARLLPAAKLKLWCHA